MSYLVLARKYRPKTFSEMVGQDHVVRALTNALETQRLHHAYLFTGTRGVGKTTVSRILAKSLNCVGPDGQGSITANPCGVCQACRDIDAGRFVDYVELDAASNRGVDETSQLLEQAVYKPVVGRFKVFMIDEAHMLSNTAFNAMLKTLEEPPEYLKFVLATTDPQKVPVTVLSRCLQFNLRPMAPETIYEHLQQVLGAEQIAFDAASLRLLSRAAHGSMRDALSVTDQAIAYGNGQIEEQAVRQMLGSVDRSYVYRLIEALAAGNGKGVIELVDFMRAQGLAAAAALEEMAVVFQRMAVLQVVPDARLPLDPDDEAIAALAPTMSADEIQLLYSIVLHGQDELGLASDEYAALVMVLLRLLAFKPAVQNGGASLPKPISSSVSSIPPMAEKKTPEPPAPSVLKSPLPETASPAPVPAFAASAAVAISQNAARPVQHEEADSGFSPPTPIRIEAEIVQQGGKDEAAPIAFKSEVPSPVAKASVEEVQATGEGGGSFPAQENSVAQKPALEHEVVPSKEAGGPKPHLIEGDQKPPLVEDDLPPWLDDIPHEDAVDAPPPRGLQGSASWDSRDGAAASAGPAQAVQLPEPISQTDRWAQVVDALLEGESVKALARELALNAQLMEVSGDETRWVLSCARQTLLQESIREKLAQAMQNYLGHPVDLIVNRGEVADTPAMRRQVFLAEKQAKAQAAVNADPDVQRWMKEFPGARIVPGTIHARDGLE